jgi:hypothetical protein
VVDKWHQAAAQIVKDVLSHKRLNQEVFAKYLHEASGGKEGMDGKDSFRNVLRRGTVTLPMFFHALNQTGTKLPPNWEQARVTSAERLSPIFTVVNGASSDSLDESVLSDPNAAHLVKQIEALPASDRLDSGIKLVFCSELWYQTRASDIALYEMSRTNDDYKLLTMKLETSTGRRITSRTLRRAFESGTFQLALFLECLYAMRSESLERYIDMKDLKAAATESLTQRRRSQQTSDE